MEWPQAEQCERGFTMDRCAGSREMQTFRKLPNSRPITKTNNTTDCGGEDTDEVYVPPTHLPSTNNQQPATDDRL